MIAWPSNGFLCPAGCGGGAVPANFVWFALGVNLGEVSSSKSSPTRGGTPDVTPIATVDSASGGSSTSSSSNGGNSSDQLNASNGRYRSIISVAGEVSIKEWYNNCYPETGRVYSCIITVCNGLENPDRVEGNILDAYFEISEDLRATLVVVTDLGVVRLMVFDLDVNAYSIPYTGGA